VTRDESDTESEGLPCQRYDSLKQEPAVVMGDIEECRASERGWRRSCGDRGIHRAGERATRVGESDRRNWYVRVQGYADEVSLSRCEKFVGTICIMVVEQHFFGPPRRLHGETLRNENSVVSNAPRPKEHLGVLACYAITRSTASPTTIVLNRFHHVGEPQQSLLPNLLEGA
jgi:hypothetical protein